MIQTNGTLNSKELSSASLHFRFFRYTLNTPNLVWSGFLIKQRARVFFECPGSDYCNDIRRYRAWLNINLSLAILVFPDVINNKHGSVRLGRVASHDGLTIYTKTSDRWSAKPAWWRWFQINMAACNSWCLTDFMTTEKWRSQRVILPIYSPLSQPFCLLA